MLNIIWRRIVLTTATFRIQTNSKKIKGLYGKIKNNLDDTGTNIFENLTLIQSSPYHYTLSKAQGTITKVLPYNESAKVLWPAPKDVIYPAGIKEKK
ncbi:hypothetical protein [Enterobacter cancerogenus]|uniref:hypothetical protein n=1 Tax=Enterobacter cancerogenus TaxID=69218 RepID=UPI001299D577|nr:hypothetical protein [Enterobacter cancerogenus]QGG10661.1 hypothetical protein GH771_18700 [Enterobacter cancerogenus]